MSDGHPLRSRHERYVIVHVGDNCGWDDLAELDMGTYERLFPDGICHSIGLVVR